MCVSVCVVFTHVHALKHTAKPKQNTLPTLALELGGNNQQHPTQKTVLDMEELVREKGGERWERTYVQK